MIICTLATASHLFRAKVLARSVKKHHPDAKMALCFMERAWRPGVRSFSAFDHCTLASDLGIPDFHQLLFTRRANEASYTLKGHFMKYLLRTFPREEEFVFLDTDTQVLGRMHEVEEALRMYPIVMTPHLLHDADLTYLQHGLYNIGFLALRRSVETENFLHWWCERTDRYCYNDQYDNGLFYEQNWLNLAPAYFNAYTLEHAGYNVAYWNLKERGRAVHYVGNGEFKVEGVPLRLFHFSHIGGALEKMIDTHAGTSRSGLYMLRNAYAKELVRMGQRRHKGLGWSYDRYENGGFISRAAREAYRNRPVLRFQFPNPYSVSETELLTKGGKLRIVQVVSNYPNAIPLPPVNQGGTEKVAYDLTEELVRRGHEVYLYAAKGSHSSAIFRPLPAKLREREIGGFVAKTLPPGVDIIHDHTFGASVGFRKMGTPVICTRHIPVAHQVRHPVYVSKRALNIIGKNRGMHVYNGINPDEYQYSEEKHDYLLFIGRILKQKGILHAMDIADRTGKKLIIAGPIKDKELFKQEIEPRLRSNPKLEYVGAVGGQRKQDLLKHASCLVFPVIWEEPFGLVMIEAMACGTPVVALNNGAVPEVLEGFPELICQTVDEMIEKIQRERFPASEALRRYVTERFTAAKMADRYLELYQSIIAAAKKERTTSGKRNMGSAVAAKDVKQLNGKRKPAQEVRVAAGSHVKKRAGDVRSERSGRQ